MKTFKVEITETLQKVIEIDANDIEDAIDKADELYRGCEIVLDSGDFVDYEIQRFEE